MAKADPTQLRQRIGECPRASALRFGQFSGGSARWLPQALAQTNQTPENTRFEVRSPCARGWVGAKDARVPAVLLASAVSPGGVLLLGTAARPLAALQDGLELVLHLGQPLPQVGVLRFQLSDAIQKLLPLLHTGRIVGKNVQGARGIA